MCFKRRMKLERRVEMQSDLRQSYTHVETICETTHPGCPPKETKDAQFLMVLPNSNDLRPTCMGGLLKVTYKLEVYGDVTCANDPYISI